MKELRNEPGTKHDVGKPRYDLIPPEGLEAVALVMNIGALKYGDRNWEKGMSWGRVFGAMMRHAWAWWRGEEWDQQDGQHHLDSVIWCAMVLRAYVARKPMKDYDDRPTTKGLDSVGVHNGDSLTVEGIVKTGPVRSGQ